MTSAKAHHMKTTIDFMEDEDNVLMESKRVPSAKSAAIVMNAHSSPPQAAYSNIHT